jgi:nitroreductase
MRTVRCTTDQPMSPSMTTEPDAVLALLASHASARAFSGAPLPSGLLERAVAAAQCAATSSNMQAYGLVEVTSRDERARLAELCGDQAQVREAGTFLVVVGDLARHARLSERAGQRLVANLEAFLLATIDATLFAQNLVVALEAHGQGTCYIGGLRNRIAEVDALLELPPLVLPLFGLCAGPVRTQPERKPRLPTSAVLHRDRYPSRAQSLAEVDAYDERMRPHFAARGRPDHTWSGAMARLLAEPRRAHLLDYYRSKGIVFEP